MKGFVLSIIISVLALCFVSSNGNVALTQNKRSCGFLDIFGCCLPRPSAPDALKNLMPKPEGGTKETEVATSPNLLPDQNPNKVFTFEKFKFDEILPDGQAFKWEQLQACRVGLDRGNKVRINIITQDDKDHMARNFLPCKDQLGYFLRYHENAHAFMTWDWEQANWFFTSDLSGCDMFVAKNADEKSKALIVHGNLNKYGLPKDEVENFRIKGEMAEKIVSMSPGYRVVMRLYRKKSNREAISFIEDYMKGHSSPGSKIFLYQYDTDSSPQGHLFFGRNGKFYVKPKIGGETKELEANLE